MKESGKENIKTSESSKPSLKLIKKVYKWIEKCMKWIKVIKEKGKKMEKSENSTIYYHYSLNFRKEINFNPSQITNDVGYIISTALGKNKLYGALFLTNLRFNDPRTAQQYLALTYTPRFRYKVKTDQAIHICDNKGQPITFRTCPAFGKHGGAGEWVILPKSKEEAIQIKRDHFYPEGGKTDRWYMGGWNRKLLEHILAKSLRAFSGKVINIDTLKDSFTAGGIELEEEDRDLLFDERGEDPDKESYIIATNNGIVIYKKIDESIFNTSTNTYLLLLYLSVSVGYQPSKNSQGIYVKFWGNIWTDILKFEKNSTSLSARIKIFHPNSTISKVTDSFNLYNDNRLYGVRVINKNIIMGDYFVTKDLLYNLVEFRKLIRSRAEELKNLLTMYPFSLSDNYIYWGIVNYPSIIYLPTLDERSLS